MTPGHSVLRRHEADRNPWTQGGILDERHVNPNLPVRSLVLALDLKVVYRDELFQQSPLLPDQLIVRFPDGRVVQIMLP